MGKKPHEAAAPTSPDNIPSSLIQTCSQIDGYDEPVFTGVMGDINVRITNWCF